MALQSLPTDLKEKVRKACQDQGVDYDEAIEALSQGLIGDVLAYSVWQGPGPGYPDLSLDVFVLTPVGLFGYEVHQDGVSITGCAFLDAISEIGLAKINEPLARHVLIITRYEAMETLRIFSDDEGFQAPRAFHRNLILARDEYAHPHTKI